MPPLSIVAWAARPSEVACSRPPHLIVADRSNPKAGILAVPPLMMVVTPVAALVRA